MKKSKLTKVIASSLILASVLVLNPVPASAEWAHDNTGWWYTEASSWATGWKLIDGNWYYFNSDGYMAHDTKIDECKLNSNGVWIQNAVLATIGDEKITTEDFDKLLKKYDTKLKQKYGDNYATNENVKNDIKTFKKQLLKSMISEKILLKKATDLNLKPSDDDLNKQALDILSKYKSQQSGNLSNVLQQNGVTENEFKELIKDSIIENVVQSDMLKDVTVEDDEIKTYYDQNKDSTFVISAGATVSHILVADEGKATRLKAQLDAGADFATLAKGNSLDSGTKDTGGNLGFIPYNSTDFVPEFMDAYKKLKEGEISNPVKSQYGYHLIKVTGIKDSEAISFNDAKDSIKTNILKQKQATVFNNKIKQWETELNVKTYENNL